MSTTHLKRNLIENDLSRALGGLQPAAKVEAGWVFVPPAPGIAHGTAALEDDWLVLSVPVSSDSRISTSFQRGGHWSLAVRTGELAGGSKLQVIDNLSSLHLRNEIWVGNGRQAAAVIDSGCHLFREGLYTLVGHPGTEVSGEITDQVPISLAELEDMAASEGWILEQRDSGDLVTSLDLGHRGVYQIRLRCEPGGHLRAWTEILGEQELDPACRQALGLLLAKANDQLRLVRGAVFRNGQNASLRFEVLQRAPFSPEQINLMLSSLTAACWKCGPEIRLLAHREIAQRYLKSFGTAQLAIPA